MRRWVALALALAACGSDTAATYEPVTPAGGDFGGGGDSSSAGNRSDAGESQAASASAGQNTAAGGAGGAGRAGSGGGGAVQGGTSAGSAAGSAAISGKAGTSSGAGATGGSAGKSASGGTAGKAGSGNAGSTPPVLRISKNGRYFVDEKSNPFRIKCDAGWLYGTHASVTMQNRYMDGIIALGFNTFILMNIVNDGGKNPQWDNLNEPNDYDDVPPFKRRNDFTTRNGAYFDKVSNLIDRAAKRGLYVMFFHTFAGYDGGDSGWENALAAQTDAVAFDWGVYLGKKFTQDNIVWMHYGDDTPSGTPLARMQQVIAGIRSVTKNRLASSELFNPDSHAWDISELTEGSESYGVDPATNQQNFDWFYGMGPSQNGRSYTTANESWVHTPVTPSTMGEPDYYLTEQAHHERHEVRRAQHWAFTAGSIAGSCFGHHGRWNVAKNWADTFNDPATLEQSYRLALYDSLKWWLLRPSGTKSNSPHGGSGSTSYCGRVLIVSGGGSGDSLITSAMTSDGTELIAYVPPTGTGTRTFAVDLRSMAGTTYFRWWNPTTGASTKIGSYSNKDAARSFTTPGNNGTGQNDWMLVGVPP